MAKTLHKGVTEVGSYIFDKFFDGDVERLRSKNPNKSASLRKLAERCGTPELPITVTWLYNAVNVAVMDRLLPKSATAFRQLPPTHQENLVRLKDPDKVERFAERAVKKGLSVRDLKAAVKEELSKIEKDPRGRKPKPLIALRFLRAQMLETAAGLVRDVYAIVPKPKSPKASADEQAEKYQRLARSLLSLHWNRTGIHPLWIEDYADVPEIIEEIASREVEDDLDLRKSTRLAARLSEVRCNGAKYAKIQKLFDDFISDIRNWLPVISNATMSANLMLYNVKDARLHIVAASSGFPPLDDIIWSLRLGVRDCDEIKDGIRGPQGVSGDAFRLAAIKASASSTGVLDRLPEREHEKLRIHPKTLISIPVREPQGVRRIGVVNIDVVEVAKPLVDFAQSDKGGSYLVGLAQSVVDDLASSLGV